MTTRITLWLLLMVAGVQALADGLFTVSRRANNALAGTTFDVALFDDTPVSDSAAERAYNKSLDFVRAEKRAFAFLLSQDFERFLDSQYCEQDVAVNFFACSLSLNNVTYSCTYTPINVRFEQGAGSCEL